MLLSFYLYNKMYCSFESDQYKKLTAKHNVFFKADTDVEEIPEIAIFIIGPADVRNQLILPYMPNIENKHVNIFMFEPRCFYYLNCYDEIKSILLENGYVQKISSNDQIVFSKYNITYNIYPIHLSDGTIIEPYFDKLLNNNKKIIFNDFTCYAFDGDFLYDIIYKKYSNKPNFTFFKGSTGGSNKLFRIVKKDDTIYRDSHIYDLYRNNLSNDLCFESPNDPNVFKL